MLVQHLTDGLLVLDGACHVHAQLPVEQANRVVLNKSGNQS